jgi:hypothetical protein
VVREERARYEGIRRELGELMTREEEALTRRHEEEMAGLLVERWGFGIVFNSFLFVF